MDIFFDYALNLVFILVVVRLFKVDCLFSPFIIFFYAKYIFQLGFPTDNRVKSVFQAFVFMRAKFFQLFFLVPFVQFFVQ